MRTITLIPAHIGVSVGEMNDRPVGVLTLVGSGSLSDVVLEVMIDPAAMGGLEAATSECRTRLRAEAVAG